MNASREQVSARRRVALAGLLACLGWLAITSAQGPGKPPVRKFGLFTPAEFLKASRPFSPEGETKAKGTWVAAADTPGKTGDPKVLRCTGKPTGYLRTVQAYGDFQLSFQWRDPKDENGNSGVLLYTSGPDKIWPRAIQVQLHSPKAGSILTHSGAQTENMVSVKDLVANPTLWNTCQVTCRKGTITVTINGKKAGTVTGCMPRVGQIALQSEGSQVWFRNIKVTAAPPVKKTPAPRATTSP